MLTGISIVCFFTSYAVSLLLEISRLFFRAPVRYVVSLGFAGIGVLLQGVYFANRFLIRAGGEAADVVPPGLGSWYDWCLAAAWFVAAAYLVLAIRDPQKNFGLFLLPIALLLLAIGWAVRSGTSFSAQTVSWGTIHGLMLLAGTVVVVFGFAAGAMYLVQSYRLKQGIRTQRGLRLPSLERLHRAIEPTFFISTALFGLGLLSGMAHSLAKYGAIRWGDPVVWTSSALFLWLFAASAIGLLYRPAREGRKVAYVVVASFLFLFLEVTLAVLSGHGSEQPAGEDLRSNGPRTAASDPVEATFDAIAEKPR
ncbi:MAG TPA: hypothetical protein VGN57_15130 [Pirellulaceae bacterium]|nr:hypothetical protein [Pirellulaceae bacterium]